MTGGGAVPSAPTSADLVAAYRGRRVLVTGHTGFKGAWLTLWLAELGADVTGFALAAEAGSLHAMLGLDDICRSMEGDIRDEDAVARMVRDSRAEIVIHLAAQSLVRRSYREPLATFAVNALGTANLLEAIRRDASPRALVAVTSDKSYEPRKTSGGHREGDPLGGSDPYSASKGAAEIIVASYRRSFFPPEELEGHGIAIASARAGNVIGGGDWAADRIVPDTIRALMRETEVPVRSPNAVRPWQHVLEPLGGYLLLGARLSGGADRARYVGAWNFGPPEADVRSVAELVDEVVRAWGTGSWAAVTEPGAPAETAALLLNTEKARRELRWTARWDLPRTVSATVDWYRAQHQGADANALADLCRRQIAEYLAAES